MHLPGKRAMKYGVILVHPFAEERVLAQRGLYSISKCFEQKGIASFRFDFMGHGDSDGDFEESSITTRVRNIKDAVDCFRKKTGLNRIILVGLRLGASIAMLAREKIKDIENVVLISPVISGEKYINQLLRTNLTYQMAKYKKIKVSRETLVEMLEKDEAVNIDGYLLSGTLYKEIASLDLLKINYDTLKRILIINLAKNDKIPKDVLALEKYLTTSGPEYKAITVSDPQIWKASNVYDMDMEKTAECILDWLLKL